VSYKTKWNVEPFIGIQLPGISPRNVYDSLKAVSSTHITKQYTSLRARPMRTITCAKDMIKKPSQWICSNNIGSSGSKIVTIDHSSAMWPHELQRVYIQPIGSKSRGSLAVVVCIKDRKQLDHFVAYSDYTGIVYSGIIHFYILCLGVSLRYVPATKKHQFLGVYRCEQKLMSDVLSKYEFYVKTSPFFHINSFALSALHDGVEKAGCNVGMFSGHVAYSNETNTCLYVQRQKGDPHHTYNVFIRTKRRSGSRSDTVIPTCLAILSYGEENIIKKKKGGVKKEKVMRALDKVVETSKASTISEAVFIFILVCLLISLLVIILARRFL
jgi:hypothetical protein